MLNNEKGLAWGIHSILSFSDRPLEHPALPQCMTGMGGDITL